MISQEHIQAQVAAAAARASQCPFCDSGNTTAVSACTCTHDCGRPACIFNPSGGYDGGYYVPVPVFDPAVRVRPAVYASRYDDPGYPTGASPVYVDGYMFTPGKSDPPTAGSWSKTGTLTPVNSNEGA